MPTLLSLRSLRACLLVLVVGVLLAPATYAAAQELPPAAAEALRTAQRLASEALITYARHFPDQPLWAEALAAGEMAAVSAPDHPAPHRFLAQAYGQVSWYARSWSSWQRYLEVGGALDATATNQLLDVAFWLGIRAFDAGSAEQAETYLETVVLLDPDNVGAQTRLARLALDRGNPQDAQTYLERLDETAVPDLPELRARADLQARHGAAAADLFLAGREAQRAGDQATAYDRYKQATDANDTFVDAWHGRATAAAALERPADAAEAWQRVLQFTPGDPEATAGLARARDQVAFGVAAQRAFERGVAAYRAGDVAGARAEFLVAISQTPAYVDALAWLGRIAADEGSLGVAATRYRSALALAPDRADLGQALAQVETRQADRAAAQAPAAEPEPETEPQPRTEANPQPEPTPEPDPTPEPVTPAPVAVLPSVRPPAAVNPSPTTSIVVLDSVIEHQAASLGGSGAFTFIDTAHLTRDLGTFRDGTLHMRLDVNTKPTDDPVHYQFCLVQQDIAVPPACTFPARLVIRSVGSSTLEQPLDQLTGGSALDLQDGIAQVMLVLRQPDGTPIDDRLLPGQTTRTLVDPSRYYPMRMRITAILVTPGTPAPNWP